MNIVDRNIVLSLNASWLPIGRKTIKEALIAMAGGLNDKNPPAMALDINYENDGNGNLNFDKVNSIIPVRWEDWINLPIREGDLIIHTSKMEIRAPTVIINSNYNKIPKRIKRLTNQAILERDKNQCQYTGKILPRNQLNVDHVISKDEWRKRGLPGSPDNWTNMVACDKQLNSIKGNKSIKDLNLNLIREPKAPLAEPCIIIKDIAHVDWNVFLLK